MKDTYTRSCEERNTVSEVSSKIARFQTFLGNSVNVIGSLISDFELFPELFLVFLDQIVRCDGITSDPDNRVLGDVRVFEDGCNITSNILSICNRDTFFSGSGNLCFVLLELDSSNWIRQFIIEEEA